MGKAKLRHNLSAPGLMRSVRNSFQKISDPVKGRQWALPDVLMSGLAIFSLKYPSLLSFDRASRNDKTVKHNLKKLFGVRATPCDTAMRERLDKVDPFQLRGAFKKVFAALQRGKGLEPFNYLGHYLLSVDGTGYFSSSTVHCDQCCKKHHRDGSVSYYHMMLGAVLVHPEIKQVIPLPPEQIMNEDGSKKNDCERNAGNRMLPQIRREHPKLKLIVLEDGLASNGPHIKLLQEQDMRYILGAKPGDHKFLFEYVESSSETTMLETVDSDGMQYQYRYLNQLPLNKSHSDLMVNFLECWETDPNGKRQRFSWVTDLKITARNVEKIMRAGRARWKVENETFNTLKNQGYHFEHNFGHGKKFLASVFSNLMMLAFLIDQVQGLCCQLFQQAQEKAGRPRYFWHKVRSMFDWWLLPDWETMYGSIAYGIKAQVPKIPGINSS